MTRENATSCYSHKTPPSSTLIHCSFAEQSKVYPAAKRMYATTRGWPSLRRFVFLFGVAPASRPTSHFYRFFHLSYQVFGCLRFAGYRDSYIAVTATGAWMHIGSSSFWLAFLFQWSRNSTFVGQKFFWPELLLRLALFWRSSVSLFPHSQPIILMCFQGDFSFADRAVRCTCCDKNVCIVCVCFLILADWTVFDFAMFHGKYYGTARLFTS